MKQIIGAFLMLCGLTLGFYVGVWLCFIGGIIQVVEAVRADVLSESALVIGIIKIMFAGLTGWLSALLLIVPGYLMAKD